MIKGVAVSLLLFLQSITFTVPTEPVTINLSGYVQKVCNGSLTLGIASIPAGGQAKLVTAVCPTLQISDVISVTTNVNIFTVAGYLPNSNGILTISVFPTAGQINVAVANNTSKAIIPAPLTLNYKVTR